MEHTHFSPLGTDPGHTDREHRTLGLRGRFLGGRRPETGGNTERKAETKKESPDEKTKEQLVKEKKDVLAKRIKDLEEKIAKLEKAKGTKELTEKVQKMQETMERSLEEVEKEIQSVEYSVATLVQKYDPNPTEYNTRRKAVLQTLQDIQEKGDNDTVKKKAGELIASLKDPEPHATTTGAVESTVVRKPQDLNDAEEFVKNPKSFVEKAPQQKESSNSSEQKVGTAREEAFAQGREEARIAFNQRVNSGVAGEDWQFILEGESSPTGKQLPTLYRRIKLQDNGTEKEYLVSFNPEEQTDIKIHIYDPETKNWENSKVQDKDKILETIGTNLEDIYAQKLQQELRDTRSTLLDRNSQNRKIGDFLRSGKRQDFDPKSELWRDHQDFKKIISGKLKAVDTKEDNELNQILLTIDPATTGLYAMSVTMSVVETSVQQTNALLPKASPNTLKNLKGFSEEGFVKPESGATTDYTYVKIVYKDGKFVIEKDEKKSKEYNEKVAKVLSAKSNIDTALRTFDEKKIKDAVKTLDDLMQNADQTVFRRLEPFELQGMYLKDNKQIRFSIKNDKRTITMTEDLLSLEQRQKFIDEMKTVPGVIAITLDQKENTYVITADSTDSETVQQYASEKGMNPDVKDGKIRVTVTKFDERLRFFGPGFQETNKDSFLRTLNTWQPYGNRLQEIEQSITDINRYLPSLTQEAYETARKTVLQYSTGTISFSGDKFVFTLAEKKVTQQNANNEDVPINANGASAERRQPNSSAPSAPATMPEKPQEPTIPNTDTAQDASEVPQKPQPAQKKPESAKDKPKGIMVAPDNINDPNSVVDNLQARILQKYEKLEKKSTENTYINMTVGPIGKDEKGNNMYRISCDESNDDATETMKSLSKWATYHGLVAPGTEVTGANQLDITITGYEKGFGYTGPWLKEGGLDKPRAETKKPEQVPTAPRTMPTPTPSVTPSPVETQESATKPSVATEPIPPGKIRVSKQTTQPLSNPTIAFAPESAKPEVSKPTKRRTDADSGSVEAPTIPEKTTPIARQAPTTKPSMPKSSAETFDGMPEYRASSVPPKPVEEPGEKRIVAPGKILAKEAKVKREAVTKAIVEQQKASMEANGWKYNPEDDTYSSYSMRARYNPRKEYWEIRENGGRYDYLQDWKKPSETNIGIPRNRQSAEGFQKMNRALTLTPTEIDRATGTEIDPQTDITPDELDGLRRDLVHLRSVRENREKDYDATQKSSRGIVDALIAEIEHIRQNPALIREKVMIDEKEVTQEQYNELIDKAKVYADRNNMLVEMSKKVPDTKAEVLSSVRAIHESLMKRIDEMIRVREQDMLKKSDELKNSGLFQSFHQGLTGLSPLQIEVDTLMSEVRSLKSAKRQMQYGSTKEDGPITRKDIGVKIERERISEDDLDLPGSTLLNRKLQQDIEANAREDVGATLDSLLRIRTLLQTINKVDADAGRKYEEDLEGIEVSKDVAVSMTTLLAGVGGNATTLGGKLLTGATYGGAISGSVSAKENYNEVQAGRKTVEKAVKDVAQDTTVGVGGGLVGAGIGHGISKVKLPTRPPVVPTQGRGSVPPSRTTVTVESIKRNPLPPKFAGNLEGPPSTPKLTYREGAPVTTNQPQPKLNEPAPTKGINRPKAGTPETPTKQPTKKAPKAPREKAPTGPKLERQEVVKLETPKDAPIEIKDLKTGKDIMGYNATGDIELGKPLKIKVGSPNGKVEATKIVRKIVVEADGTIKITAGEGAGAETYQIVKMRKNHPPKAPKSTTTKPRNNPPDAPPPAGSAPSPKGPDAPKGSGSGSKGGNGPTEKGASPKKEAPNGKTGGADKKSSPSGTSNASTPEIVDAKLVSLDPTKEVPTGNMTLADYLGVPRNADDKTVRTALTRMAAKVKNADGSVVNTPEAKKNWKVIAELLDRAKGDRAIPRPINQPTNARTTINVKPPLSASTPLSQFIAL